MIRPSSGAVAITAPAKLNLGLEILRRRDDGYHDLSTIFLTIDIVDHLSVAAAEGLSIACDGCDVGREDNLALRAATVLRDAAGASQGAAIRLRKAIPTAAGLGGASSDAAAALLAARELWDLPMGEGKLGAIAGDLGSDVPFFLQCGCALGEGRGEQLTPLPVPTRLWFLVVSPPIAIPRKTATLFALLKSRDFSDGERTLSQADRLRSGRDFDPSLLGNAFSRPLYEIAPELADLPKMMRMVGASVVAISGAGPSHYAPFPDAAEARRAAARLRERLPAEARIFVATPVPQRRPRRQAL